MGKLIDLLPVIAVAVIFWLLVLRPAQRRARETQQLQSSLIVGDSVVTTSGIHGLIREVADDIVKLEVAPDVILTIARGAVGQRLTNSGPDAASETEN